MMTHFRETLRPALVMLGLMTVVTGIAYPLAVTGIAQVVFPEQAGGSLVHDAHGAVVGSALIGQAFARGDYFHGRPSAAGKGYDAANSGASNDAPGAAELRTRVAGDVAALGRPGVAVPADLVTTSASGLDPDISPEAALFQVPRVARARGMTEPAVRDLVQGQVQTPWPGFLGATRINVLALNRALDALAGRGRSAKPAA